MKPIHLLKVSDVAHKTQISPSQVYIMIQEGMLPQVFPPTYAAHYYLERFLALMV